MDQWCLRRILNICCVQSWSVANNWTASSHVDYPEKASDAVWPPVKSGLATWCQENSYRSSLEWLEKAARTSSQQLLAGHSEEWSIIQQPHCGRCHWAGTGQATLQIIGSKWHWSVYNAKRPLKWRKWTKVNIAVLNANDTLTEKRYMCSDMIKTVI